jgi:hypothetical protein
MTDTFGGLVWVLEGGGTAVLVESDGDRVTLISSRAYPPGSPLTGDVKGALGTLQVKVHGSQRSSDDEARPFVVRGRFINLTRAQRHALTTSVDSSPVE